ncbi:Predicted PurR-regulated permease PerM [Fontimonas thermophila]|uniref:Predicted PurR-regulated permease PerM n=1 Tax=Fontimonas thermophila TaxID=1076937 RepID=A0A1I2KF54_9GAMM|nr:AI-2E family transporter [Fontimonas thermophila]SFF65594.1 Predicted PurR-regulated permease PerM [Fontimonas thermophila]
MAFSLDQFYRLNRKALIWLALAVVLWLLRDFFGLVFLTFVIAFFAMPAARRLHERLRLPYRAALVVVYLLFLGALAGFGRFVMPNIVNEGTRLVANLGAIQQRLIELDQRFATEYPALHQLFSGYLRSLLDSQAAQQMHERLTEQRLALEAEPAADDAAAERRRRELLLAEEKLLIEALFREQAERLRKLTPHLINFVYQATATMALALLFSFLILIDLERLQRLVRALQGSRLHDVYAEAAGPLVRFTQVIGQGLRAQAMIALTNTALTLLGLLLLGIPSIAVLSMIVFVCSFIPVLGVFISTVPIVLVALNTGGVELALWSVVMIVVIHAIEAYGLNPLIYGRTLQLNPVLTLIILFVAYHVFGIWGMLLGVPTARYLLSDVLRVALDER